MPGKLPAPYDNHIGPGSDIPSLIMQGPPSTGRLPDRPIGSGRFWPSVSGMDRIDVRQATAADHSRIVDVLSRSWGSTTVIAHGVTYDAATLPALLAERRGRL